VLLDNPIKTLGLSPVRVMLHPEVFMSVTVNVARSPEEAERQARGEAVTGEAAEEEAASIEELLEAAAEPEPTAP
jgi:large subunit ribosomal protein L9